MGRSPDSHPAVAAPTERGGEARRRIEEEHRRLRELLRALTRTRHLERIDALLTELSELLGAHFAGEEGPEGLHDIVSTYAAHRLPDVQRLFAEHREIQEGLERLRCEVAACIAGPARAIHERSAALVEQLRRHEAVEDDLFGESFYLDIGGRS
jgi:hypothetical protein